MLCTFSHESKIVIARLTLLDLLKLLFRIATEPVNNKKIRKKFNLSSLAQKPGVVSDFDGLICRFYLYKVQLEFLTFFMHVSPRI